MVYKEYPKIQIVGICFGHQVLSLALGGSVERMNDYLKDYEIHLFMGKENIELKDPSFFTHPLVSKALLGASEEDLK